MGHHTDLPASLGSAFTVREAERAGVGRGRRNATDLARPFHGVRAAHAPVTFEHRVRCLLPRLREGQQFSGRTAARMWGLPLPWPWHPDEDLVIASPAGSSPPRTAGVRGMRLAPRRVRTWTIARAPVIDPVAAVFSVAGELSITASVILIDALLSSADNYPGLLPGRPRITRDEITTRLAEWGRFRGKRTIRAALERAREGVESPKETETRLLIVNAGLPEPVVQFELRDDNRVVARMDLAYPELQIGIEYEGDGHRTDRAQWRRDIQRQRDLEDRGWIVVRLTQHDLGAGAASFLARLRRAIASRQA